VSATAAAADPSTKPAVLVNVRNSTPSELASTIASHAKKLIRRRYYLTAALVSPT